MTPRVSKTGFHLRVTVKPSGRVYYVLMVEGGNTSSHKNRRSVLEIIFDESTLPPQRAPRIRRTSLTLVRLTLNNREPLVSKHFG